MTEHAAACDLVARETVTVPARGVAKVPTGVWIADVAWDKVPSGSIPELQVRARSGLAFKHAISLANGIGTIDADYRDEICVLLVNHGEQEFVAQKGERIAQMAQTLVYPIECIPTKGKRAGGFGSTGR